MSDFEKEHLEELQSNCFWAGFLIDLPKDEAWRLANLIVEEIEFVIKQANGLPDTHEQALPINIVSQQRELLREFTQWLDNNQHYNYEPSHETIERFLSRNSG